MLEKDVKVHQIGELTNHISKDRREEREWTPGLERASMLQNERERDHRAWIFASRGISGLLCSCGRQTVRQGHRDMVVLQTRPQSPKEDRLSSQRQPEQTWLARFSSTEVESRALEAQWVVGGGNTCSST